MRPTGDDGGPDGAGTGRAQDPYRRAPAPRRVERRPFWDTHFLQYWESLTHEAAVGLGTWGSKIAQLARRPTTGGSRRGSASCLPSLGPRRTQESYTEACSQARAWPSLWTSK